MQKGDTVIEDKPCCPILPGPRFDTVSKATRIRGGIQKSWATRKALKVRVALHVARVARTNLKRLSSGSPIPLEHRYLTLALTVAGPNVYYGTQKVIGNFRKLY